MINLVKATLLTLLLALSFSMQTSAQTTAANNAQTAASLPRKADGSIDFDKWSEGKGLEEFKQLRKSLNDKDFDSFIDWFEDHNAKLDAKLANVREDNAKLDAKLANVRAEGVKLDANIQAYKIIDGIQKKLLKSELITDVDMANFKIAANTPGVDLGLISRMKKHLGIN
jgi:ABC-type uncharacterized transport system YnjBCD substrate-binding protein